MDQMKRVMSQIKNLKKQQLLIGLNQIYRWDRDGLQCRAYSLYNDKQNLNQFLD